MGTEGKKGPPKKMQVGDFPYPLTTGPEESRYLTWRRQRQLHRANGQPALTPSTEHGLVGIGLSGGGIRSATINLGIAQVLDEHGIFDHADYLSTVSGGGYLGASISTLMRRKPSSRGKGTAPPSSRSNRRQPQRSPRPQVRRA